MLLLSKCIQLKYKIARTTICLPVKVNTVIRCTGGGSGKGLNYSHIKKVMSAIPSPTLQDSPRVPDATSTSSPKPNTPANLGLTSESNLVIDTKLPDSMSQTTNTAFTIKDALSTAKRFLDRSTGLFLKKAQTNTIVATPSSGAGKHTRGYSTHEARQPEANPKDPQASLNNPKLVDNNGNVTLHLEIQRLTCTLNPLCKYIACQGLCGPLLDCKAVANFSHGQPKTVYGKVVPLDSTDYNGNAKAQNAVVYYDAHTPSTQTPEVPAATKFLQKPHVQKTLMQYEDKK